MYCKHCGVRTLAKAKFCKKCGQIVPKRNWLINNKYRLLISVPIVVFIVIYLINSGASASYLDIFPFWQTNPKTITLTCTYAGKNLKVEETYYGNINNYYANRKISDKSKYLQNGQFDKFVYVNPKDKSIGKLISDIKSVALSNHLNDDQTLELTSCFVQNIAYDDDKSKVVLNQTGNNATTEQYPYQTLYSNKGICTDKAYLGSALIKELGYGTALMVFQADKHMALAINVPAGYTSFNTKYAILDVTSPGFTPGTIPAKINDNGTPFNTINEVNNISDKDDPSNINFYSNQSISPPSNTIVINSGKQYSRIVAVKKLENEVLALINTLDTKKSNMQKEYNNIGYWNNRQAQAYSTYLITPATTQSCYPSCTFYPYYSCRQNCTSMANISKTLNYSNYTSALRNYNNAVSDYNKLVNEYNATLTKINSDINIYKTYQYN